MGKLSSETHCWRVITHSALIKIEYQEDSTANLEAFLDHEICDKIIKNVDCLKKYVELTLNYAIFTKKAIFCFPREAERILSRALFVIWPTDLRTIHGEHIYAISKRLLAGCSLRVKRLVLQSHLEPCILREFNSPLFHCPPPVADLSRLEPWDYSAASIYFESRIPISDRNIGDILFRRYSNNLEVGRNAVQTVLGLARADSILSTSFIKYADGKYSPRIAVPFAKDCILVLRRKKKEYKIEDIVKIDDIIPNIRIIHITAPNWIIPIETQIATVQDEEIEPPLGKRKRDKYMKLCTKCNLYTDVTNAAHVNDNCPY